VAQHLPIISDRERERERERRKREGKEEERIIAET
jgi:hypothetical protein